MRVSFDFHRIARNALRNKWILAVIIGLIASILGGVNFEGIDLDFSINIKDPSFAVYYGDSTLYSTQYGLLPWGIKALVGGFMIFNIIKAILKMVVGSFIGVGYARFNMNLVNDNNPRFENLFAYMSVWKTALCTNILAALKVFLWSLLLVIPGIVARYKYALTDYILAETPNIKASEALDISTTLMQGNKWRLFCLEFSFIGWDILAGFTFGIGNIFLTPYKEAAKAAFYMDVVRPAFAPFE